MHEPQTEATLRPTILFVVLAVHLAILALILATPRAMNTIDQANRPIELVFLNPAKDPKVLIDNTRPQFLKPNIAMSPAPPDLNSLLQAGPVSSLDDSGSSVNWVAEAHRAVGAFEIRRDQSKNSALSVSSSLEEPGAHENHAGDYSRTENGDWIVWINANCYKIASWHSGVTASGAISPRTICRKPTTAPRGASKQ